ncbi:MAG: TIM barrel protein [candidate division WOR-3 bacterium]
MSCFCYSSNSPISTLHKESPKTYLLKRKGSKNSPLFKISLCQWSLHRHFFKSGEEATLDFPLIAKRQFGIDAVEYVDQLFPQKIDKKYIKELKNRSEKEGIKNLLIMRDREGNLGAKYKKERTLSVENHYKWIDIAKFLNCHSIRVNAIGEETPLEQKSRIKESLLKLLEYAMERKINIIIENHGGLSEDPDWLSGIIKEINNPFLGSLPDFGNFPLGIDRYEGIKKLLPFAKGISAKSYNFDENGNETP